MRNVIAMTILIVGSAGAALAQNSSWSPTDAPLLTDKQKQQETTQEPQNKQLQRKKKGEKADCGVDKQSSAAEKNSRPDRNSARPNKAPEQGPQNVVEYGG